MLSVTPAAPDAPPRALTCRCTSHPSFADFLCLAVLALQRSGLLRRSDLGTAKGPGQQQAPFSTVRRVLDLLPDPPVAGAGGQVGSADPRDISYAFAGYAPIRQAAKPLPPLAETTCFNLKMGAEFFLSKKKGGFAFNNTDNPQTNTFFGGTSALDGFPEELLANGLASGPPPAASVSWSWPSSGRGGSGPWRTS